MKLNKNKKKIGSIQPEITLQTCNLNNKKRVDLD